MILVIADEQDAAASRVEATLQTRGCRHARLTPRALAAGDATIALNLRRDGSQCRLRLAGTSIALDDLRAVWYAGTLCPDVAAIRTDGERQFALRQWRAFGVAVCEAISAPAFPGRLADIERSEVKWVQLVTAAALGFTVPDTVIGTDRDEVCSLFNIHGGNLISKVLVPPLIDGPTCIRRLTAPVTRRDMLYADRIRWGPAIVQPNLRKRLELRVTVVEDRVFSAAIFSQVNRRTRSDWRRHCHDTPYQRITLDDDVDCRCIRLVRSFGLRFAALDLVVTERDELVFLELNPLGQWLWVEEKTGLPIAEAIGKALLSMSVCGTRGDES